jgi:hypothetical protein
LLVEYRGPLTIDEVVAMATNAHRDRSEGLSAETAVDIRNRGPYFRWMIGGAEIGGLHFQPPGETTQRPIGEGFAQWTAKRTEEEREHHERLKRVLLEHGAFDYVPIYRRDRFVIDGAHRSLAAFDVSISSNPSLAIEIYAERFDPLS